MQDQPSLLSRMKDPYQELQDQEILTRHNPQPSDTQPSYGDNRPSNSASSSSESNSEFYQDVLIRCNSLVERYRNGEISKASVLVMDTGLHTRTGLRVRVSRVRVRVSIFSPVAHPHP